MIIFQSIFFILLFLIVVLLITLLIILLRLSLGIMTYRLLPKHFIQPRISYIFFVSSMILYLPIVIFLVLLLIYGKAPTFLIILLGIVLLSGLPIAWIQSYFIAKNISILYHNEPFNKDKWPLSFRHLGSYPLLFCKKVHIVLYKMFASNTIA